MLCPYTLRFVKRVFQLFVRLSGTCLKHFSRFYSSLACCVSHNEIPRMHWQPQSLLFHRTYQCDNLQIHFLQFYRWFSHLFCQVIEELCSNGRLGPQLQVGLIVVSNLPTEHKIRLLSQNRSGRSNLTPPQKGRFELIKILWCKYL